MPAKAAAPPPLKLPADVLEAELGQVGGPVPLFDVARDRLFAPCREYPWSRVCSVHKPWAVEGAPVDRHWPWVAYAAYGWAGAHLRPASRLRPTDVHQLLKRVAANARTLSSDLRELIAATQTPGRASEAQAARVSEILVCLGAAANLGGASPGTPSPVEAALISLQGLTHLLCRIEIVADAAAAEVRLDRAQVSRQKGAQDPALADFVGVLALVWRSLTGRKATAQRVQRKPTQGDEDFGEAEAPDFVLFVRAVARLVADKQTEDELEGRPRRVPVKLPTVDAIGRALRTKETPA